MRRLAVVKREHRRRGGYHEETIFDRIERRRKEREVKRAEQQANRPTAEGEKVIAFNQRAAHSNVLRDRRVPLASIEGLLVKTLFVIDETGTKKVEIERKGGPTSATLRNWEMGYVRRPNVATLRSALEACGYRLAILDPTGDVV